MKPDLLENILKMKNMRFEDFFNLDRKPQYPSETLKFTKETLAKLNNNLKLVKEYYRTENSLLLESLQKANFNISKNTQQLQSLETTIDEYKAAYESLLDLIQEIISKEELDLRKYSTNLSDEDWRKINRGKRIDNIIDKI